ncbi:hypothetical protein BCR43DRAFT_486540 [Syncephalastrum racemosum]|uniref:Peptide hydrolase n=1 Tax=Syncephalastrum racemosum TaxID=13706 RepID=A0A1X2HP94_SYNRA|nr:hypothetical protein BCR43DRAFT_486540 [Syncephalastrum racemosum]
MPSENDINEQTPLLSNSNQQGSSLQKQYQTQVPNASSSRSGIPTAPVTTDNKSPIKTYAYLFTAIAIVVLSVFAACAPLPVALSETAAETAHDFAGLHAYNAYLSRLTEPHSVNSRAIIRMQQWLGDLAGEFKLEAEANGLNLDVIVNDTTRTNIRSDWFADNEQWFIESRNVILRLRGQSKRDEALLLNAHYDAVPAAYGVTDNGAGVATLLELIRYFIHHPPQHDIIFLFNNFEEGGLLGAKQFIEHPWFKSVKMFINLEGAGAGGRALLFRCSSLEASKLLSKAKLANASPLGNDMFRLGLIKSDTDYTIFNKEGVPGMDIAFYKPRSHYHTPRDNLENFTPGALQHMGHLALTVILGIDAQENFLTMEHDQNPVYYDIIDQFMFAYSFPTMFWIHVAAFVAAPVIGVIWTLGAAASGDRTKTFGRRCLSVMHGFFATFSAFIFITVFNGIASALMVKSNPLMTYGNAFPAALYLASAGIFGLILSQIFCDKISSNQKKTMAAVEASLDGLTVFWSLLMVLSAYLATKNVAFFYYAIFIFSGNLLGSILYRALPSDSRLRTPLVFLVQIGLPLIVCVDQLFMTLDAMRHAPVDGTPEIAVFALMSLPLSILVLQLLPWVHKAGEKRSAVLGCGAVLIFFFVVCTVLPPFNASWSPNKVTFNTDYTAGDALASVTMTFAAGLPGVLKHILPANETETMSCGPHPTKANLQQCIFQTNLLPRYGADDGEFSYALIDKSCKDGICVANGVYTAKNSLLCRVRFDTGGRNGTHIRHAWVNGLKTTDISEEEGINTLLAYHLNHGEPVHWGIEYLENSTTVASHNCFYDEWNEGEMPAWSRLLKDLPEDYTLFIRGQGLANVYYGDLQL